MIDDTPGSESDLAVSHVITVRGTVNANGTSGTSSTFFFDGSVKGTVESIDLAARSLVLLGQTLLVGPDTSFDDGFPPASLYGVSVNQIV